ncbi:MAG: Beta-lactamase [Alphaproteobacteria bacterium]|nr:Beta-lactamase [Alphaproteobacteria bacterium]
MLLLPHAARAADGTAARAIQALERKTGAQIGLAALDSGSGKTLFHRPAERFVMCSTFKLSLAAATLARADKSSEQLDRLVMYDKPVLGVSPATTRNWPHGMTIAALCEAAIIYSDNTAANVLLAQLGGPDAVTAFWRGIGDKTSRLDDNEPKLNIPDGVRNTTTPIAMMGNLKNLLLGESLSASSRARLLGWMHANTTGGTMLKAGLPPGWAIGDKTGRNPDPGLTNDIAIITPPARKPILAAVHTRHADDAVIAGVGRILADEFA